MATDVSETKIKAGSFLTSSYVEARLEDRGVAVVVTDVFGVDHVAWLGAADAQHLGMWLVDAAQLEIESQWEARADRRG